MKTWKIPKVSGGAAKEKNMWEPRGRLLIVRRPSLLESILMAIPMEFEAEIDWMLNVDFDASKVISPENGCICTLNVIGWLL